MKKLILLCLAASFILSAAAQNRTIYGNITTENDEPLAGASILIKHSSYGTTTEVDSTFELEKSKSGDTLVVSYLGFSKQEIVVADKEEYRIRLKENIASLSEVIVKAVRENNHNLTWCGSIRRYEYYFTNNLPAYNTNLNCYPNPTDGAFSITNELALHAISIANANGQILKTITQINENQVELDISTYPSGNYFIIQHTENDQPQVAKVALVK